MFALSVLARLATVAVAAVGVAIPATPTAAARTICVGIVVDARSLSGPVAADCTTVPAGSTGYDVLRAAGHTVGFRQDGLICTIDNRPAQGCSATDASHYWAYFHRAPHSSSWAYSNEGATTYQPANGETEGWVWRDGRDTTPQNVPYQRICPQSSSPSSPPSTAPTTAPRRTHPAAAATPSARPAPALSATSTATATHRAAAQPPGKPSSSPPTPAQSPAASDEPSTRAVVASATSHDDGSSGPSWGLIAGIVAIAALGGGAALRWRQRAGESA